MTITPEHSFRQIITDWRFDESLLADAVGLLWARALWSAPRRREWLAELALRQSLMEFDSENAPDRKTFKK